MSGHKIHDFFIAAKTPTSEHYTRTTKCTYYEYIYIQTTKQHSACLVGAPARRHHSEALETPSGWWHVHQKQTRRRNEIDMLPLSIVTMTENSHGQKGQPVTREGPRQTEAVSDLLACTAPGTRYFCRLRFSLFSYFSLRRMGKNKA